MKRRIIVSISLAVVLMLGIFALSQSSISFPGMNKSHLGQESPQPKDMRSPSPMMMGHHGGSQALKDSTGTNELNLPPILESDRIDGENIYYTIEAQKGQTEIFEGVQTATLGYNGNFLGPVIPLKKGQKAHFTLKNNLDEETTFHWHGLVIDGDGDGGPHEVIEAGEEKEISFDVIQDRATLWFHPHPLGKTAKQVYEGLAGLIYIEDEIEDPYEYGVNDFPLIVQDRLFTEDQQLDYRYALHPDGTVGDTTLINGTVNPKLTVQREKVCLRLLNGSNKRDYTFALSNGASFELIASDGGLLNEPIEKEKIKLTPAERAEIIVDFSDVEEAVSLVDEEGTVLMPFQIEGEKQDKKLKELTPINKVEITEEEKKLDVTKEIVLSGHGHHVTINGKKYDPDRIDLTQSLGETEVWEVYNEKDRMGGMMHPFHIHGTQFKVISINGETPPKHLQGYKDTIDLNPGDRAKLAVTFEKPGVYMYHCHILEHEENGMMGQVKVE